MTKINYEKDILPHLKDKLENYEIEYSVEKDKVFVKQGKDDYIIEFYYREEQKCYQFEISDDKEYLLICSYSPKYEYILVNCIYREIEEFIRLIYKEED